MTQLAKICDFIDCRKPVKAKGLCQSHYEQTRSERRRPRPERALYHRARQRALSKLAANHPEEFEILMNEEMLTVVAENNLILTELGVGQPEPPAAAEPPAIDTADDDAALAVTAAIPVPLRPGRKADGQTAIDRIAVDIAKLCKTCGNYHESGHHCPACAIATRPGHIKVTGGNAKDRIRRLLIAGKSAQWLVNQGEKREEVYEVLRELNREAVEHRTQHSE